jgi:hypothetical protein
MGRIAPEKIGVDVAKDLTAVSRSTEIFESAARCRSATNTAARGAVTTLLSGIRAVACRDFAWLDRC